MKPTAGWEEDLELILERFDNNEIDILDLPEKLKFLIIVTLKAQKTELLSRLPIEKKEGDWEKKKDYILDSTIGKCNCNGYWTSNCRHIGFNQAKDELIEFKKKESK